MKYFSILIILFCYSCGKFDENNLINESKSQESYRIVKSEQHLTNADSTFLKRQRFSVYDSKNRLINKDDNAFFFYDENDRLIQVKQIYKREGKGIPKINIHNYLYNSKGKLANVIADFNGVNDTIRSLKYNALNQLIEDGNGFKKTTYIYDNQLLLKKSIYEDNNVTDSVIYQYDQFRKKISQLRYFSGQKLKTYFVYGKNGKIKSQRDSVINQGKEPCSYVEYLTEFAYDKNDSLTEIRHLGRVLSEKEFQHRGRDIYLYRKVNSL